MDNKPQWITARDLLGVIEKPYLLQSQLRRYAEPGEYRDKTPGIAPSGFSGLEVRPDAFQRLLNNGALVLRDEPACASLDSPRAFLEKYGLTTPPSQQLLPPINRRLRG